MTKPDIVEWYLGDGKRAWGPDKEIKPRYGLTYRVVHGFGTLLATFNELNVCIGWTSANDLGFHSAGAFSDAFGLSWIHDAPWSPYA